MAAPSSDRDALARDVAPAPWSREPIRLGAFEGFRYAELPKGFPERVLPWLEAGTVPDGRALKAPSVFRTGELCVKFFGPSARPLDRVRRSPAVRSADAHRALLPLKSPRPYLAVERRERGTIGESVLVSEYVDGRTPLELYGTDDRALEAFPHFLARMHDQRLFHGDFHLQNMLWDGRDWFLLDLVGLRHPLRNLARRRLIEGQWARIAFELENDPGLRKPFDAFVDAAGLTWDKDAAWSRVQRRLEEMTWARRT